MNAILVRIGDFFEGIATQALHVWETQPLVITALATLLIDLGISFGLPITQDQKTILVGIVSTLGLIVAHKNVTPVNSPTLAQGTIVTVTTPPGEADKTITLR